MCDLWETQIHDSSSDGVEMDILAAMNRVTLDIVGLAGERGNPPVIIRSLNWCPDSITSHPRFRIQI